MSWAQGHRSHSVPAKPTRIGTATGSTHCGLDARGGVVVVREGIKEQEVQKVIKHCMVPTL